MSWHRVDMEVILNFFLKYMRVAESISNTEQLAKSSYYIIVDFGCVAKRNLYYNGMCDVVSYFKILFCRL